MVVKQKDHQVCDLISQRNNYTYAKTKVLSIEIHKNKQKCGNK